MNQVLFKLDSVVSLATCVAVAEGRDARNPLPSAKGIYVIYNSNNHNVYVGITDSSFQSRFSARVAAISELGLDENYCKLIYVWFGCVYEIKGAIASPLPVSALGGVLKGILQIDLEHLLIRMYTDGPMNLKTCTNTKLAKREFRNSSGDVLSITAEWCHSDSLAGGAVNHVLNKDAVL